LREIYQPVEAEGYKQGWKIQESTSENSHKRNILMFMHSLGGIKKQHVVDNFYYDFCKFVKMTTK